MFLTAICFANGDDVDQQSGDQGGPNKVEQVEKHPTELQKQSEESQSKIDQQKEDFSKSMEDDAAEGKENEIEQQEDTEDED